MIDHFAPVAMKHNIAKHVKNVMKRLKLVKKYCTANFLSVLR
jgi:hypothetical protein